MYTFTKYDWPWHMLGTYWRASCYFYAHFVIWLLVMRLWGYRQLS